jgi:iron complex transport system ATP-binding protein
VSRLEIDGLSVRVEGRDLVREITLAVDAGAWVTVIGPNGAGKTTLVETVAGVRRPSAGQVRVEGSSIHEMRERERARRIAFVPQHPVVPAGMAVRDYVGLGRTAHQGVLQALSEAGAELVGEILDRLGLRELAGRDVSSLSGGERQRAVLARALAQSTNVLVLDEPTTGLDLRHQIDMLELLRREVVECQLTIVSTLHDLSLAGRFADELVLLDAGALVERGPSRDVVRSAALARVYEIPLAVIEVDGADVVVPSRGAPPTRPGATPGPDRGRPTGPIS